MIARKAFASIFLGILLELLAVPLSGADRIALNEKEYFAGPGFSFLVFHNNYEVGYQGGLQMILNDERVLDSGDLLLELKHGQGRPELRALRREVDRAQQSATVFGEIEGWNSGYRLITRTDGRSMFITLKLDKPLDWSKVEQAGFRMAIYPGTYFSASYQGDKESGVFPHQYTGRRILCGPTTTLRIAQEDPLHSFTVTRQGGSLLLVDTRQGGPESWFLFVAPLTPGSDATEVNVTQVVQYLVANGNRGLHLVADTGTLQFSRGPMLTVVGKDVPE